MGIAPDTLQKLLNVPEPQPCKECNDIPMLWTRKQRLEEIEYIFRGYLASQSGRRVSNPVLPPQSEPVGLPLSPLLLRPVLQS